MPQLRWEGGKGAKLRGKVHAESSSEVSTKQRTLERAIVDGVAESALRAFVDELDL